ncbi:Gfo/Idh/MocA family oxidoreductase [Blastopirellula sp. J2-11]|uniref:Gfo/Idh/MocA family protein n=1 Tax=Blastopirellula sp. J2-11 TaxID=2943192 RepID=UPI0021C706F3|nr:Gfo/Idh/MocA family oxidoreductase [Blastopirellula sp. J2-11]UUO08964.1 Gfo/Idh/MocA family oxidoreductase [Blastopirellula sp. J2-11]
MNLKPDAKKAGKENFNEAVGVNRRDFLKGVIAAGAVSGGGLGAMYFGYSKVENPVRIGVIGTGDEGSVLIGALNPDYVQVVAISDIRPYNVHRAFHGDHSSEAAYSARRGLMNVYGWKTEEEARQHVKVYEDYHDLLADDSIEGIICATPLFLHHPVVMDSLKSGKHVLTEKLMAHNITQCKQMGRAANEADLHLATGHQRHYSVLYDNAVNLLQWGLLGEIHHIRAQWHRGNLPGADSWSQPLPGGEVNANGKLVDKILDGMKKFEKAHANGKDGDPSTLAKNWAMYEQYKAWNEDRNIKPENFGYQEFELADGRKISAMEELCRWRLWDRTGGGLMAELGSHQLDAASIFISAMRKQKDGKKVHPLTVHATGGRQTFPYDRDADDHVYCTFEFPGPGYDANEVGYYDQFRDYPNKEKGVPSYEQDPNKKVVVTYSSINGNGYGGYGEVVMGTKGTLILETEKDIMLLKNGSTSNVKVKDSKDGPTMDTQASGAPTQAANIASAATSGPVSRGYTEEIEHWAYCIRNPAPENKPKCHPEVAMGDAVIALTARLAIQRSNQGKGGYVQFKPEWFDLNSDATPEEDLA